MHHLPAVWLSTPALLPIRLLLPTGNLRRAAHFDKPHQNAKAKTRSLRELPIAPPPRMRGAMDLCRRWELAPFWPGYRGVANIEALADAELSSPAAVAFECIRASATAGGSEGAATDACAGRRDFAASITSI